MCKPPNACIIYFSNELIVYLCVWGGFFSNIMSFCVCQGYLHVVHMHVVG